MGLQLEDPENRPLVLALSPSPSPQEQVAANHAFCLLHERYNSAYSGMPLPPRPSFLAELKR